MKWKKFTLKTRSEAEDIVISTLAEAGVEGVEIEDKVPLTESDKQQMFVDILPEGGVDDGVAYLNFYLEEDEDEEALLARVREELEDLRNFLDIGECTITRSETEDKDWINNWKHGASRRGNRKRDSLHCGIEIGSKTCGGYGSGPLCDFGC